MNCQFKNHIIAFGLISGGNQPVCRHRGGGGSRCSQPDTRPLMIKYIVSRAVLDPLTPPEGGGDCGTRTTKPHHPPHFFSSLLFSLRNGGGGGGSAEEGGGGSD